MPEKNIRVKVGDTWYTVQIDDLSASPVRVTVEGKTFYVEVEGRPAPTTTPNPQIPPPPRTPRAEPPPPAGTPAPGVSNKLIRAPMAGKILAVTVRPGDTVSPLQEVCVVEAMKMDQSIITAEGGVIKAVHVQPLQQVDTDAPLVELE